MRSDPFPTSEQIASATTELVAVVRRRLPFRMYSGERWWTMFREASLVRMAATVESLMDLMPSRRDIDGHTLLRSLYEQVVTFAWIAIDPDRREWRWVNKGLLDLLKLHNDALQFEDELGERVLTDERVAEIKKRLGLSREPAPAEDEASAASASRRRRAEPDPELLLPAVTEMAREADLHWSVRVRGLHPADHPLGFRGLYLPVYRLGSRTAHGGLLALEPFVSRAGNRLVINEAEPGSRLVWALPGPLFGIALIIAARWEQWIDDEEVRALVDLVTGPEA